jgi:hypothetical protein
MFREDHRSTGLMVDGDVENNPRDNPQFGAFFAFGPKRPNLPAVALEGRGCEGFDLDDLRARYRVVVQNYRLLDCEGAPIDWKDNKIYSAAAIGVDRANNVVLMHLRAPYQMRAFTKIIAAPELDLVGAMYVEGGPEATLALLHDAYEVTRVGSYESFFLENDSNDEAWALPNVIGFAAPAGP